MMNRKAGDWDCRSCSHLNFSRRESCQRCGEPRAGGEHGGSFRNVSVGSDVRPGDWYCSCGTHNFASRFNCFKCSAFKENSSSGAGAGLMDMDVPRGRAGYSGFGGGGGGGARSGWKSGDWMCNRSGCNEHNFASRMECFRCSAPRESTN